MKRTPTTEEILSGAAQNPNNIRNRTLAKSVERADANLAKRDANSLPEDLTPHSLRRTFISLLLALGEEVPYVMRQVGHADPKVTLSIYARVMFRGEGETERLRALVEGSYWALSGTGPDSPPDDELKISSEEPASPTVDAGTSTDAPAWFRTRDLSRVKRALSH